VKRKLIPFGLLLAAMLSVSWPVDAQQPTPPAPVPTPVVEPTVTIKVDSTSVQVRDIVVVSIESNGTATEVDIPVGLGSKVELKPANDKTLSYLFQPKSAGRYTIYAVTTLGGKLSKIVSVTIEVVDPTPPVPPAPVPPAPTPTPTPTPDAAPIKEPGLRVLIVYESADMAKYPSAQIAAIYSQEFWSLLNTNCVKGSDGKTPDWRFFDQNVDVSKESAIWQAAMKRERKSLPWILVSNGVTGFEGPLPATLTETSELVRKYVPLSK
jgi:hypothetical protein